jgi:hypothetical protein
MSYGRNFEFRVPPHGGERGARYELDDDVEAVIGCGVEITEAESDNGRLLVDLASGGEPPLPGVHGIAVYEYAPAAFAGDDPLLTTYSDKSTIPANAAVQVVSGTDVKVCFRNTSDRTFLTVREYEGRTMVAGFGATPTVAVGDYLEPFGSTADDDNGWWKETATLANAWLVVTKADSARGEVEARMLF